MCILDDYPRFLDKVIKDYLVAHRSRREQVESYCENDCNDDKPIEDVLHVHGRVNLMIPMFRDLFRDDLLTYTTPRRKLNHIVSIYA